MSLPRLTPDQVRRYLDRLGLPRLAPTLEALTALQWAHLRAVPFHNLALLANDGRDPGTPDLARTVEDTIAGVGGTCHLTTPPFATLLLALGFDVQLAAASVAQPGDHIVAVVTIEGHRYLCDVGNGHPYPRPWRLDVDDVQSCTFAGWHFRFEPMAEAGPRLRRQLDDGSWRTVYTVDPTPRRLDDFTAIIHQHHTVHGFGPFLQALRAVRITDDAVWSVRDAEYRRDTRTARTERPVCGWDAARALLVERLELPGPLVGDALAVLARKRPHLLASRPVVPDVLVTVATIGRPASLARLLRSIVEDRDASRYPGRVGVIVVDNCGNTRARRACADVVTEFRSVIPVHRIEITQDHVRRGVETGLLPPLDTERPACIGAAREAQLAVLHEHLVQPFEGLPHPSEHPMVVWMVDDDVAFLQRTSSGVHRCTDLLFRAARAWAQWPQHSVILGTFTGDPPIPGLDTWAGQLGDIAATVRHMAALGLDARWTPFLASSVDDDAYYDLAEARAAERGHVPWRPSDRRAVEAVLQDLLSHLPRLLCGAQLTRPLLWDGTEQPPRPSLRRGGNTLFLDLDALFRWPTPAVRCEDVVTRRSDTIWAALAARESPGAVVEATLPVLHGRDETEAIRLTSVESARQATDAQVRGTALARAVTDGRAVGEALRAREAAVAAQRASILDGLRDVHGALEGLRGAETHVREAVDNARLVLGHLAALAEGAIPTTGDPGPLQEFVAALPERVRAWREAW